MGLIKTKAGFAATVEISVIIDNSDDSVGVESCATKLTMTKNLDRDGYIDPETSLLTEAGLNASLTVFIEGVAAQIHGLTKQYGYDKEQVFYRVLGQLQNAIDSTASIEKSTMQTKTH